MKFHHFQQPQVSCIVEKPRTSGFQRYNSRIPELDMEKKSVYLAYRSATAIPVFGLQGWAVTDVPTYKLDLTERPRAHSVYSVSIIKSFASSIIVVFVSGQPIFPRQMQKSQMIGSRSLIGGFHCLHLDYSALPC